MRIRPAQKSTCALNKSKTRVWTLSSLLFILLDLVLVGGSAFLYVQYKKNLNPLDVQKLKVEPDERVLGTRNSNPSFVYNVNIPALFKNQLDVESNLTVGGEGTFEGGIATPSLRLLGAIDTVTTTTIREALGIEDDNTLNGAQLGDTTPEENSILLGTGDEWVSSPLSDIDTVGTLTEGTWEADPITADYLEGIWKTNGVEYSFPESQGSAETYLQNDGNGNLTWAILDSQADLTASAPLSYNPSTGLLSISAAGISSDGYLSSSDWNIFNSKQNALTLVTEVGTNVGIGTTNPTYKLEVAGTIGGTQLYQNGYQVCDESGNCSGVGSGLTGTGTVGYIPRFQNSTSIINSNLYDNGTNVGIGTTNPLYLFDVNGDLNADSLYINGTLVSASASELNLLDGRSGTLLDTNNIAATLSTWDQNSADDLTTLTNYAGDVTGVYNNLQIATGVVSTVEIANSTIIGQDLNTTNAANDGQVLTYDLTGGGFTWVDASALGVNYWSRTSGTLSPATSGDNIVTTGNIGVGTTNPGYGLEVVGTANVSTLYLAGAQITASASEINLLQGRSGTLLDTNNIATLLSAWDQNSSDDLTTGTSFAGDVTGSYNNLQIGSGTVGSTELSDGSIAETDINATNAPVDGNVLTYNQTGGVFTWVDPSAVGVNYWNKIGSLILPATITDDVVTLGNIGIGTTAPSYDLDVNGSANVTDLYLSGTQVTSDANELNLLDGRTGTLLDTNNVASQLSSWDQDSSNDVTTTTSFSGDVTGTYNNLQLGSGVVGNSELANDSVNESKLNSTNVPDNGNVLTYDQTTGNFTWVSPSSVGTNYWNRTGTTLSPLTAGDSIFTTGNVGIGATSPLYNLNVSGSANITTLYLAGTQVNATATEINLLSGRSGTLLDTNNVATQLSAWDQNAANDLITTTSFSGDVTGTYSNLQLGNNVVTTSEVTNATLLAADLNSTNAASNGQILTYDLTSGGFTWVSTTAVGVNYWQRNGTTLSPLTTGDYLVTTGRVGVGNTDPSFDLDVTGDINFTGVLRLNGVQLSTTNVPEGSNQYYTDARARGAVSATAPLTYTSATGVFGINQATGSSDGYLSSGDWTIFNNKLGSTLNTGYIFVGNGSNTATGVAMSGDASISSTGALTLANSGVSAGTYGSSTQVPVVSVDSKGRVTSVSVQSIPSYENPLTFLNGLTRSGNDVLFGGALTQNVRLYDGSHEYIFMDTADGNVGVGTTDPGYKLHVSGSLAGNTVYQGGYQVCDTSGNCSGTGAGLGGSGTTNFIAKFTGTYGVGSSIVYDDGTNVGIGTTAPGYTLDVAGDVNAQGSLCIGGDCKDSWADAISGEGGVTGNGEGGQVSFFNTTSTVTGSNNLFWNNTDARLGIGTTAPTYNLHVTGSVGVGSLYLSGTQVTATATEINLLSGRSGTLLDTNNVATQLSAWDQNASNDLTTGTSFAGDVTGSYSNLQLGSGVVGTSEISDGSIAEVDINATNNPSDGNVLTYDQTGGIFTWVAPSTLGVNYWDRTGTVLSPITAGDDIVTTGSIGIGTTAPAFDLDVAGNINLTGTLNINGSPISTSNVTEGSNLYFTNTRARSALSVTEPLTYSSTTGVFGINQAGAGGHGYLTSTDWNTFNNKLGTSLTAGYIFVGNVSNVATGVAVSGDASLSSTGALTLATVNADVGTYGNTTNIPQITVDAKGRITAVSNQSISYESPLTFGNGLTRAVNAVSLGGQLSTNTRIYDSSNREMLYFDNTNGRIGIGTTGPATKLDVLGTIRSTQSADGYSEFAHANSSSLPAYPRSYFYGYGSGAVTNYGFYVAPGNATGATQIPSFMGISTNKDPQQAASKQLMLGASTTASGIFTITGELLGTVGTNMFLGGSTLEGSDAPLWLTTTGNVGIGTATPGYKLDVNGNIRIASGSDLYLGTTAVLGNLNYSSNNYVTDNDTFTGAIGDLDAAVAAVSTANLWNDQGSYIYPDNSSTFVITDAGNLGVGTTTPQTKLEVQGTIRTTEVAAGYSEFAHANSLGSDLFPRSFIYGYGSSSPTNYGFYVAPGNATGATQIPSFLGVSTNKDPKATSSRQLLIGASTTASGIFTVSEDDAGTIGTNLFLGGSNFTGSDAPLWITTGGNIGIGTSSPSEKLQIAGNIAPATDDTYDLGTTSLRWRDLYLGPGSLHIGTSAASEMALGYNSIYQRLEFTADGSATPLMTLTDNGKLGIGTVMPVAPLNIDTDTGGSIALTYSNASGVVPGSLLGSLGFGGRLYDAILETGAAIKAIATGGNGIDGIPTALTFFTDDGLGVFEERMRVHSSGNVGIGSTSPNSLLSVGASNQFQVNSTGAIAAATGITSSGTVTLTGIGAGTDNSVLVLNSSNQLVTDEIDSRVWGTSLADGTGSTNYLAKWSDSNTVGSSVIYDDGTNVGIGTATPSEKLEVAGKLELSSSTFPIRLWDTSVFANLAELNIQTGASNSSTMVRIFPNGSPTAQPKSGIQLFNTDWAASTTNYESLEFRYANNIAQLFSSAGGTGTVRPVQITTGSNTGLFINSSGNIGVGTTSPTSMLSVGASSQFQVNSTGNLVSVNGVAYSWPSEQATSANQVLTNDGNGNLTWGAIVIPNVADDSLDFAQFMDNMTLDASTNVNLFDGTSAYNYRFYNSNTSTESLYIDGTTGYLGIGTTSPAEELHVVGNITSPGSSDTSEKFGRSAVADALYAIAIGNLASSTGNSSIALGYAANVSGIGSIAIGNSASTSGNNALVIGAGNTAGHNSVVLSGGSSSAGNNSIAIGLGATSNAEYQFVAGSSTTPVNNVYFGKGVSSASPTAYTINGTEGTGGAAGGGIYLEGGAGSSFGDIVLQSAGGYVGIGTTDPTRKLDVIGDINISGGYYVGGTQILRWDSSKSNLGLGLGAFNNYATVGNYNLAIGSSSQAYATGSYNVSYGPGSLENADGNNNTAIGYAALRNASGASQRNVAVGFHAGGGLYLVPQGSHSNGTFVGYNAGERITTGGSNIIIGYQAADQLLTGTNNIILGYDIDTPAVDTSNYMSIGNLIFGTGINGTGTTVSTGNIGIGTTSPTSTLSVGGTSQFQVNSTGNVVRVNDVPYSWPSTQGDAGSLLLNDGSGNLSWATTIDADTLGGVSGDSYLRSDASDSYTSGTLSFAAGTFLDMSAIDHSTTTPQGLRLPQNSSLQNPSSGEGYIAYDTVAKKVKIFNGTSWTDISGSASTLQEAYETGNTIQLNAANSDLRIYNDLSDELLFLSQSTGYVGIGTTSPSYKLHLAGSGDTNLFGVFNGTSEVFSVTSTQITSAVPHQFTAAADVAIAYDLQFLNQSSSYIKSNASLYLEAGEVFESNNLTLRTFNSGKLVMDTPGGATLAQAQNWDLVDSLTALNIETNLMNFDTTNRRIGVGTNSPQYELHVSKSSSDGSINNFPAIVAKNESTTLENGTSAFNISSLAAYSGGTAVQVRLDSRYDSVHTGGVLNVATNHPLDIRTNDASRIYITNTGDVGIGTTAPQSKLEVSGGDIRVTGGAFIDDGTTLDVPDYVFETNYDLMSLDALKAYVNTYKHLPHVPEMNDTDGWADLSLQDRDMRLLEKIEETVLYLLKNDERITALENQTGISLGDGINETDLTTSEDVTLRNVTVTGTLNAGFVQVDSLTNTLQIVGPSCYTEDTDTLNSELCTTQALNIMPNLAGNVDLFAGKVVFEPNGNVTVDGTLTANTVVADEFKVKASSATAGSAKINQGQTEVIVESEAVKPDSKILVTATSKTGNQTLIVEEKVEGTSFKVVMEETYTSDVTFDWWIVNVSE